MILLSTSHGDIKLSIDEEKAPISVANFLAYVKDGFYNGTIFHRVIPGFMIQGGGMDANLNQKPTKAPIKNEASNGLHNIRGTIAMARTQQVDSATAQFFINLADNKFLDYKVRDFGYAVFGQVVEGMDTVDRIAAVATGAQDVPKQPVTLISAKEIE